MLDFLFGSKKDRTSGNEAEADPTKAGIRYDPELITELKSDHGELVAMFHEISAITRKRDPRQLSQQLDEFGQVLQKHLLKENVRFYIYLKSNLPESSQSTIQRFAREMQQIGRAVTDFLYKYTTVEQWDSSSWTTFEKELASIGTVLVQRIQSEENDLYTLYLPPSQ
ncbi:MAG TPA: hemerythrin domain-containing protein [Gallionella sp.]